MSGSDYSFSTDVDLDTENVKTPPLQSLPEDDIRFRAELRLVVGSRDATSDNDDEIDEAAFRLVVLKPFTPQTELACLGHTFTSSPTPSAPKTKPDVLLVAHCSSSASGESLLSAGLNNNVSLNSAHTEVCLWKLDRCNGEFRVSCGT